MIPKRSDKYLDSIKIGKNGIFEFCNDGNLNSSSSEICIADISEFWKFQSPKFGTLNSQICKSMISIPSRTTQREFDH